MIYETEALKEHLSGLSLFNRIKFYVWQLFPNFYSELENVVRETDCNSLLDVGCGCTSPVKFISKKMKKVGVDLFLPAIEKAKKSKIHDRYINCNVLDIDKHFKAGSMDCVVAIDLIEHITKKEGYLLLEKMEKISSKVVVIITPNGYIAQGEHEGNPYQEHRSGWTVSDMQKKGYTVIGLNGLKQLKGDLAAIKKKPRWFWSIISMLSIFYTRSHPENAFHIMCIKKKN